MPEILEVLMMVCFGASWPFSVARSYRSRSTQGKSLLFLLLIGFGYLLGISGKLLFKPSYVIAVYLFNACMVFADIILYFRNKRYENEQKAVES